MPTVLVSNRWRGKRPEIRHWVAHAGTGSRLVNALNINSYHSPTKFLQPANLTACTILSLFSLQVELAPPLLSHLSPDHPYLPHYKSPTALSHMHHLTCGISSLLSSFRQPHSVHCPPGSLQRYS